MELCIYQNTMKQAILSNFLLGDITLTLLKLRNGFILNDVKFSTILTRNNSSLLSKSDKLTLVLSLLNY